MRCRLMIFLGLCCLPGIAFGARRMLDVRPVYQGPTERVLFHTDSGSEDELVALRQRLVLYGARKIVFFVPDVIVCDLPTVVNPAGVAGGINYRTWSPQAGEAALSSGRRAPAFSLEWVERCYALHDRDRPVAAAAPTAGVGDALEPGESLPWAPMPRDRGAGTQERSPIQNSDLMLGDILAQLVFPESGALVGNTEEWTDERMSNAATSASLAFLYYQDRFQNVPLNFTIRQLRQIATSYEPIKVGRDGQGGWINEVMTTLGFEDPSGDYVAAVTAFNNAAREQFETEWVFTSFIVSAERDDDYRFAGGPITLPNVGGPYFAIPFPVSDLRGTGQGDFGQAFKHDVGHIFWALDEQPGGNTDCQSRSGYLNTRNFNKQTGTSPFGAKLGCSGEPDDCIMNSRDAMNGLYTGDPCEYTAGMFGLSDSNDNGVPDGVDDFPVLEFATSGIDTVQERTFTMRFKAVSTGVQNQNPAQTVAERVNYAVPVRIVARSENGVPVQRLDPVDGEYDEIEEDFAFDVTALPSGMSELSFVTRHMLGRFGNEIKKRIFYLGLTFLQFEFTPSNDGIGLAWVMFGERFGAQLDLHRVTLGDNPKDEVIASGLTPVDENPPFAEFEFFDGSVVPTQAYRYYVEGTFDLMYRGEMTTFVVQSEPHETTAVLPFSKDRVLSRVAPNPFTDRMYATVFIPALETNPDAKFQDLSQLHVIVGIYDVAGRRVKTVFDDFVFSQVMTVSWDGTNENNTLAPAGIYFMKATVGPFEATNKVVLVR